MNGAITNARELWRQLAPETEGREPLPNDAALPGLAVGSGRPALLDAMRGHHAYAVVDERSEQVYLGQDRYGERPLCCVIARIDGRWQLVAFASTPAALRAFGAAFARSKWGLGRSKYSACCRMCRGGSPRGKHPCPCSGPRLRARAV